MKEKIKDGLITITATIATYYLFVYLIEAFIQAE